MIWGRKMGHVEETPPDFIILPILPIRGTTTWTQSVSGLRPLMLCKLVPVLNTRVLSEGGSQPRNRRTGRQPSLLCKTSLMESYTKHVPGGLFSLSPPHPSPGAETVTMELHSLAPSHPSSF